VTFGLPFPGGGVTLRLAATHLVKFGGSGTTAFAWPLDLATMPSQWSNSALLTELPSTVAIALPGMDALESPPQPAATNATATRANRAMESRTALVIEARGRGSWADAAGGRSWCTAVQLTSRVAHGSGRPAAGLRCSPTLYAASRVTASNASAALTTAGNR
jgi:hypothetical protein